MTCISDRVVSYENREAYQQEGVILEIDQILLFNLQGKVLLQVERIT